MKTDAMTDTDLRRDVLGELDFAFSLDAGDIGSDDHPSRTQKVRRASQARRRHRGLSRRHVR